MEDGNLKRFGKVVGKEKEGGEWRKRFNEKMKGGGAKIKDGCVKGERLCLMGGYGKCLYV